MNASTARELAETFNAEKREKRVAKQIFNLGGAIYRSAAIEGEFQLFTRETLFKETLHWLSEKKYEVERGQDAISCYHIISWGPRYLK